MKEIEVKILNIDVNDIIKKLEIIGAKRIGEKSFSRIVFVMPSHVSPVKEWIRLRTDGTKTTLTYKNVENKELGGTTEIETEVNDYETTKRILKKIGLIDLIFQQNKRIEYRYEDIEIDIDFWPKLKPYVEVEADSKEKVKKGVKLLGFSMSDTTTKTNEELYSDIGIDLNKIKELKL